MPVLVDERADAGLDARVAREFHSVLHVPKRPQDEDVLGPVGPDAVPDCGPPAGDAALDLCTAPALELFRPMLAVRLDEGASDGMDEVGVRRHVVLPCRKATPCRLDGSPPNPSEAPSARSPRLRTAARRAYVPRCGTRDAPVPRVVELRREINSHIRERLAREGRLHGPSMNAEHLVSKGYTNAEKALAGNCAVGDTVAFHRPYKRLGVEKGDERRVAGVDYRNREVLLDDGKGGAIRWKPGEIGGRKDGIEVYRAEGIELRAGDRFRWTRNDAGLGLVNSRTAEVAEIRDGRVTFRLEDGRKLELDNNDPQLRHLDHAWASTVHAFQGRTVDNVIAAMKARHPHLTTQKSFYVEISRARDRAELITDDAAELKAQLQAVTGERIAALEGIVEMERAAPEKAAEAERAIEGQPDRGAGQDQEGPASPSKDREPPVPERGRGAGMDLGL